MIVVPIFNLPDDLAVFTKESSICGYCSIYAYPAPCLSGRYIVACLAYCIVLFCPWSRILCLKVLCKRECALWRQDACVAGIPESRASGDLDSHNLFLVIVSEAPPSPSNMHPTVTWLRFRMMFNGRNRKLGVLLSLKRKGKITLHLLHSKNKPPVCLTLRQLLYIHYL